MHTYRLTLVPAVYGAEQVRELFPEEDQKLLIGPISLACSVYCLDPRSKVATVTFRQEPSFLASTDEQNKRNESDTRLCTRLRLSDPAAEAIKIDTVFEGLTPLHDPESENDLSAVDVVASTGIAGRAFGSWQHPNGTMWLRDLLNRHDRGLRILIWGQTTKFEGSRSHITIQNLRDSFLYDLDKLRRTQEEKCRPLVLIGHSLGGIIIKAAYCEAARLKHLRPLYEAIQGLVFFGTPHEGMETRHWEELWGKDPPRTLIQDLTPGSTLLRDLRERFLLTRMDTEIISCFERIETPTVLRDAQGHVKRSGPPTLYVQESSSILNLPQERRIPINADHSMIAKLSGEEGTPFGTVERHFLDTVERARSVVKNRVMRHHFIHVLTIVHSALQRLVKGSESIEILILLEMQEIDKVLQFLQHHDPSDVIDESLQHLEGTIEMTKSLYGDTVSALASRDENLRMKIPQQSMPYNEDVPWPPNAFGKLDPLLLDREHIHELIRESIPIIMDLCARVRPTVGQSEPGVIERFLMSAAAETLDLDFVAERQHDLQKAPRHLLEPLEGTYTEVSAQSSGLRLGRYRAGVGAGEREVMMEYRDFGGEFYTTIGGQGLSKLRAVVQGFATQLKAITTKPTKATTINGHLRPSLRVFELFGWLADEHNKRFVFIYDIPKPYQHGLHSITSKKKTLDGWIEASRSQKDRPPFGQQFAIAYQISQTIYDLHTCGIVHKNVNPSNILIIPEVVDAFSKRTEVRMTQSECTVYVKGLEFSRKVDAYSDHLPFKDKENNVYRHPNRQGNAVDVAVFEPIHDMYAVGAVLLELGRGKNLKSLLADLSRTKMLARKKVSAWEVKDQLIQIAEVELPQYVGVRYTRCVQRCLSGDFWMDDVSGKPGAQVVAFRRLVVDELKALAYAFEGTR